MGAKIVKLTENYRNSLRVYLRMRFSHYSDEFINYSINEAVGSDDNETSRSLLVVNDSNDIVGCHLCFPEKMWVRGKLDYAFWGHDTFLDEEYRAEIGLDFVYAISSIKNGFGYGLSETNIRIQKLLKAIFIQGFRSYRVANLWIFWGYLKIKMGLMSLPTKMPNAINAGKCSFRLCSDVNDIIIPNDGFWNRDKCDIDFVRDREFLQKRFFNNEANKYYVYSAFNIPCYFVVRPSYVRNIPSLILSDFRYNLNDYDVVKAIFKSVKILARRLRLGIVVFNTNDEFVKGLFDGKMGAKSYPIAFVGGGICQTQNVKLFVTAADSDEEFHM